MFTSRRLDRFFLIVGLLLALGFIGGQAVHRIEYYRFATALAQPPSQLNDISEMHPRKVVLPFTSADSCWWVMHTEAMIKGTDWRVRQTPRDNAPFGREVHWNSGLMWFLAFLAWLIHLCSGIPMISAVQHAALIAGPIAFASFVVAFALLSARRWGGSVGGLLAFALATLAPLEAFFCAGETDHHGIVSCLALGCVLSIMAAGGGNLASTTAEIDRHSLEPHRDAARKWMLLSGFLGAAGLWISSATTVPVFAGIAIGALVSAWRCQGGKDREKIDPAPELWRLWGRSGAIGSLAFYLLEYAPGHLGWRLEVNHPLYALAFWGGGELLARLCAKLQGGRFATTPRERWLAVLATLALIALPAAIQLGGTSVFSVQDPFLWNLHEDYITEFRSLPKFWKEATWLQIATIFPAWLILALPVFWLLARKGGTRSALAPLAIAVCAPLPITALSILQVRWIGVSQTLWLGLVLACFVQWRAASPRPSKTTTLSGAGILFLGLVVLPIQALPNWRMPTKITPDEAITLVVRDVAWRLRAVSGSRPINILSGPTTTTKLAYFGDTQGLGTLYWENLPGLKSAAAIFGAKDEEEARRLCRKHSVTHIVVFSWDAFAEPYARLHHARPLGATTDDCFANALIEKRDIPAWLNPLPYEMIPELERAGHWVLICEVLSD